MKKGIKYVCGFSILAILLANSTHGQSVQTAKAQYVNMPSFGMATVAVQPDSAVEFIDTQLLIDINTGHWIPSFRLRNRGTKPIRAFTVGFGGEQRGWKADNPKDWLTPEQVVSLPGEMQAEIVPLTPAIREKLKLAGPIQGIYMLMVVSVEYADGSHFEESGYEAVQDYLTIVNSLYYDFIRKSPATSITQKQKRQIR